MLRGGMEKVGFRCLVGKEKVSLGAWSDENVCVGREVGTRYLAG